MLVHPCNIVQEVLWNFIRLFVLTLIERTQRHIMTYLQFKKKEASHLEQWCHFFIHLSVFLQTVGFFLLGRQLYLLKYWWAKMENGWELWVFSFLQKNSESVQLSVDLKLISPLYLVSSSVTLFLLYWTLTSTLLYLICLRLLRFQLCGQTRIELHKKSQQYGCLD